MITLLIKEVADQFVQENFKRLRDFINRNNLIQSEMQFFEVAFTGAKTNFKFKHNLKYLPKDVIVLSVSKSASCTFNFDLFTDDYIDMTVSGATTVRFLAGTLKKVLA
jgi:hypothetical protein